MAIITTKTLYPGQKGTLREYEIHGNKLICVRYRYDTEKKENFKTIELISDHKKIKYSPHTPFNKKVMLKIGKNEKKHQQMIKLAGGKWDYKKQRWIIDYGTAFNLGMESRIDE